VSEKGPTSEDLNRTVDLLAGLGDERPETGETSDFSCEGEFASCLYLNFQVLPVDNEKWISGFYIYIYFIYIY